VSGHGHDHDKGYGTGARQPLDQFAQQSNCVSTGVTAPLGQLLMASVHAEPEPECSTMTA
jgi:hypothetical protein